MSTDEVERIANALLYEGYMLYPYRPSAIKNRERFNFGVVYPPEYVHTQTGNDRAVMQTECLVHGQAETICDVTVRCLQLTNRSVGKANDWSPEAWVVGGYYFTPVESLVVGDRTLTSWQETIEHSIRLDSFSLRTVDDAPIEHRFVLPASYEAEEVRNDVGTIVGLVEKTRESIDMAVVVSLEPCRAGTYKIRVRISNRARYTGVGSDRTKALAYSLLSTHTILTLTEGSFISLTEPPDEWRSWVDSCDNLGTWPVLVGDKHRRNTVLSSPIIVPDFPEIAPQSAGDLFDGTEIDELLSLRIMTMTESEKREMSQADAHARLLLERTQSLAARELMEMHGVMRRPHTTEDDPS